MPRTPALYANEKGTFPEVEAHAKLGPHARLSAEDRATRLAAVALGWNILQHFYPYFDVVESNWPAALREALAAAANDSGEQAFLLTLRLMVAALHDGHGNVYNPSASGTPRSSLPLLWDWVEGRLVITHVAADLPREAASLKPGTIVVAIDGQPAAEVLAEAKRPISAATEQWRRYVGLSNLASGELANDLALEVEDPEGHVRTIKLRRAPRGERLAEPRPPKIHEIAPGIFYVDIDRIDDNDFREALPRLEKAEGIVFDFRGYPAKINFDTFFPHLIDHAVTSPQWHVPFFRRPTRRTSPSAARANGRFRRGPPT